jgi:hypothetical protein
MEILPYFLTSSEQRAFDSGAKSRARCKLWSAVSLMSFERGCDSVLVGTVEHGDLFFGVTNETYGTYVTYRRFPHKSHVSNKSHPFAATFGATRTGHFPRFRPITYARDAALHGLRLAAKNRYFPRSE